MESGYYGKGGITRIRIGYLSMVADSDGRFADLDDDPALARRLVDDGIVQYVEHEPEDDQSDDDE